MLPLSGNWDPAAWRTALYEAVTAEPTEVLAVKNDLLRVIGAGLKPDATLGDVQAALDRLRSDSSTLRKVTGLLDVELNAPSLEPVHDLVEKLRQFDKVAGFLELANEPPANVFELVKDLDAALPPGPFEVFLRPEGSGVEATIKAGSCKVDTDLVHLPPGWNLYDVGSAARPEDRPPVLVASNPLPPLPFVTDSLLQIASEAKAAGLHVEIKITS